MNILDFFKDKMTFIICNFILFIFTAVIMYFSNLGIVFIILAFCIWFIPIFSYILMDVIKFKTFYDEVYKILNSLDKKYLLPEVVKEPQFIEGRIMNDILKEISRDMHENVKYYKDKQLDYREYIESWVHEIKTPIASSKLIIENNENEITKKIDNEINKIESYVEQSLYYSRSSDVSNDYIIKEVNIENSVRKVIKRNYRDFLNKNIAVKIEDINKAVYCDSKWIEFIINQIVGNALKYSNKGNSYIKFYSKTSYNLFELIIEDNGIGICSTDIDRVFEKGFTGENGRAYAKSTGIGLYLCKKLCGKLNIGISIESSVNEWTRVSLKFPLDEKFLEIAKFDL